MKYPSCNEKSPKHQQWLKRVKELEEEGMDTSDAQGIADMELDEL